ncbi:tail fiber assembly protein [Dickeya dianthicola]|uniref:Phage tail protein n=1 Tax=Dickeya dianthicola TaxID=204039 RepID=A0AAX1C588_9GAMM|nr:tail fiber assembly protein [Dickeya dianthicola]ATO31589.1 Tail fiber assembly protein [Dickeya dianthicola RNS04.9]MBT1430968.1 tail fiber assembly protein [Dickeya dianthicola]MCA7005060.1 tail fiber assembly protein [Dickeya dianthicola]MCI4001377.1 tail fiber assembly protein [Dickeya dianthicola]MCI4031790.1 tail fiber assembly protein [Dickeya dianthicola]
MSEKYSVAVQNAGLGKNGLAERAGWLTVYHVDPLTREYTGASYEYLMIGTGLPADSYVDAPDLPGAGQALRRTADGSVWEHVPDLRGKTAYSTTNGQAQTVQDIGALPGGLTLLAPATAFDAWNGDQWVTDTGAQQAAAIAVAAQTLADRKAVAVARINELNYAVTLGMATRAEKDALTDWQTYLVQLSRIDTAAAPDIDWPAAPEK